MKETLKRIKADVILSALLCVILGIVLIIWSDQTIKIICMLLAFGIIVMGVVNLTDYFINHTLTPFSGMSGLVFIIVGIWLFFVKPESIAMIIPIVIGVLLAVHGITDIKMSIESKANGYDKWWSSLLLGVISLALGVICIINAFGVVKVAMIFIGIALVYDGISDLWIVSRTVKAAKEMKKEADALDVDYKEVDE